MPGTPDQQPSGDGGGLLLGLLLLALGYYLVRKRQNASSRPEPATAQEVEVKTGQASEEPGPLESEPAPAKAPPPWKAPGVAAADARNQETAYGSVSDKLSPGQSAWHSGRRRSGEPAQPIGPEAASVATLGGESGELLRERLHRLQNSTQRHSRYREQMARPRPKQLGSSDHGAMLALFRDREKKAAEDEREDVFNKKWVPPKFDTKDPSYGRPKQGSLTEKRGIAAGHHVGREIIQLVEVITEYGVEDEEDGTFGITFGELFNVYTYISDKVVGMLLRARKHGLVWFEGEMLYQRRDEDVPIFLLKPLREVRRMYEESDDPAYCLTR